MKNFDIKRFTQYLRSELISSRRNLMLWLGSLAGIAIVCYGYYAVWCPLVFPDEPVHYGYQFWNLDQLMWGLISITSLVFISSTFISFFKRGRATQTMMLPASRIEKYGSRIVFSIGYVLATTLLLSFVSLVFCLCCGVDFTFFNHLYSSDNGMVIVEIPWHVIVALVCSALFNFSIFFLGATVWKSKHFLKTLGVIILVVIVFAALISLNPDFFQRLFMSIVEDSRDRGLVNSLVLLVFSAPLLWASWRRFKNLQIKK